MGFTEKKTGDRTLQTLHVTSNYDVSHMIYSIDLHSAIVLNLSSDLFVQIVSFILWCSPLSQLIPTYQFKNFCDSTGVPGLLPLCQAISVALGDVGLRLRSWTTLPRPNPDKSKNWAANVQVILMAKHTMNIAWQTQQVAKDRA